MKAKLLKKDKSGNYQQTDKAIKMAPVEAVPLAARDLQRQMGELAIKSLSFPQSERDMSGLTMGITRHSYERIKQELADCRRRIMAIVTEDDDTEQVYRLNLQLFPISECLKQKEEATPKGGMKS